MQSLGALITLCLVAFTSSQQFPTMETCQIFCAAVQGGGSYDNCAPWTSFANQVNKTCYDLCVHNCASVYGLECLTSNDYKCCLATFPAKTQEFVRSGCNYLYNNVVG